MRKVQNKKKKQSRSFYQVHERINLNLRRFFLKVTNLRINLCNVKANKVVITFFLCKRKKKSETSRCNFYEGNKIYIRYTKERNARRQKVNGVHLNAQR